MSRLPRFPNTLILLGSALSTLTLTICAAAQDAPTPGEAAADLVPFLSTGAPRWLEEVRAQRQALQQQRRAKRESRRRTIDPQASAHQEARKEAFLRRRQETLEQMSQDRRLFMNQGPWTQPPAGFPPPPAPGTGSLDENGTKDYVLPDWDNRWYYQGW